MTILIVLGAVATIIVLACILGAVLGFNDTPPRG